MQYDVIKEILEAYYNGCSLDFFEKTFFSLFEQEGIASFSVKKIFQTLKFLKSQGCSQTNSERLLSIAVASLRYPLAQLLMSRDQIQRFIIAEGVSPPWMEDSTLFLLRWYGVNPILFEKVQEWFPRDIPAHFLEDRVLRLFRNMSPQEMDAFFARFHALIKEIGEKELEHILCSQKSREFFFRVIDPSESDQPIKRQQNKLNSAFAIHNALTKETIPIGALKFDDVYKCVGKLSPEEALFVLNAFPTHPKGSQYLAEALGVFGVVIGTRPLHLVAIEPLIRFLVSMPWQQTLAWLEESITTDKGQKSRFSTLAPDQKERLLAVIRHKPGHQRSLVERFSIIEQSFRIAEANLPLTFSSQLLSICAAEMHDRSDPLDLLAQIKDRFDVDLPEAIVPLLLCAKEENMCGERIMLKWGNGSALCSAQDTFPLFVATEKGTRALYQGGLLNDPTFALSGVTLRKKLIDYCTQNPDGLDKVLRGLRKNGVSLTFDVVCQEICHEIQRIVDHLREMYPGLRLTQTSGDSLIPFDIRLDLPDWAVSEASLEVQKKWPALSYNELRVSAEKFLRSSSFKSCSSFLSLLKLGQKIFSRSAGISSHIDSDNAAHHHALFFMTLLLIVRHAHIREVPGTMHVALSPRVQFALKYLAADKVEVRCEDNFGLTADHLEVSREDYSFHTLSPITPNHFCSPQKFSMFTRHVQGLPDRDFYLLLSSVGSLFSVSEDEGSRGGYHLMSYWENALKESKLDLSLGTEEKMLIAKISDASIGYLFTTVHPLREGAKIPLDRTGVGDYTPEEEVPEFVHSEGNFASALCKFMQPQDTRIHDGSCAINAFLLGYYPANDLNNEHLFPEQALQSLVAGFRQAIVRYARDNQERLKNRFGENEVAALIRNYNDATQTEWTGSLVWECAAKLFKREIYVFSSPREEGGSFSIGANGKVEPTLSCCPEAGPEGPPIYLMHWGIHYCYLKYV